MAYTYKLTRDQEARLTEKVVEKILSDESPEAIMQILEHAFIAPDDEEG